MSGKKSIARIALILIAMLLLSSIVVSAATLPDFFGRGLRSVNSFLAQGKNNPYMKVIDFVFFALLFVSIFTMGAVYAFKEFKRAERTIAILLGLMTAFLLVLANISVTILLPYIHWIFYILLFGIFYWLLKGIKSKFWRFLLALLLTLLTIWLLSWLLQGITEPRIGFPGIPTIGTFKSPFGKISFPSISAPGLPKLPRIPEIPRPSAPTPPAPEEGKELKETPTPAERSGPPPAEKGFWYNLLDKAKDNWGKILISLLGLTALIILFYLFLKKRKKGEEKEKGEEEKSLQSIIDDLKAIIEKKKGILENIEKVTKSREEDIKDIHDLYHKVLKYDLSYWLDPDSDAHRNFTDQIKDIRHVLENEIELENKLKELINEENEILGSAFKGGKQHRWNSILKAYLEEKSKELIEEVSKIEKETPLLWHEKIRYKLSQIIDAKLKEKPAWFRDIVKRIMESFRYLLSQRVTQRAGIPDVVFEKGLCDTVRKYAAYYFMIGKNDAERAKRWEKLIDIKVLEKWIRNRDKWKPIENVNPDSIKQHFENEKNFFDKQLKPAVLTQMRHMELLVRLLTILDNERISETKMQELKVDYTDPASGETKTLEKEEAANPANAIPRGSKIRIWTRLATGIGPFTLRCYADVKLTGTKEIQKEDAHQVIDFTSEEINNLPEGEHTITFYLTSPKDTYKRGDVKKIKILIGAPSAYPPEYPPQYPPSYPHEPGHPPEAAPPEAPPFPPAAPYPTGPLPEPTPPEPIKTEREKKVEEANLETLDKKMDDLLEKLSKNTPEFEPIEEFE